MGTHPKAAQITKHVAPAAVLKVFFLGFKKRTYIYLENCCIIYRKLPFSAAPLVAKNGEFPYVLIFVT